MARRMVEKGVRFVQIFSGGWDSHDYLERGHASRIKSVDKPMAALIKDLKQRGMLEDTLVIWTGEFGRTPKISHLAQAYKLPGRDHWGAVQSVFFAGGGVQGGQVVGASDNLGAYPSRDPQKPENMAATIYSALGLPRTTAWHDPLDRPNYIYHGDPIPGLT